MLFPEIFPIFYSLVLMAATSTTIFFWRFYIFRKNLNEEFKSIPSIIVLGIKGSGKTSIISRITNSQVYLHPIQNLNFATMNLDGQRLQFIEVPYFLDGFTSHLKKFKEINLIGGIYIFDVSKNSHPIQFQLENFKKVKEFFRNLHLIPVANKIDDIDPGKIEKLESELGRIYKISATNKTISDHSNSLYLKKELDDISKIILSLTKEIKGQEISLT